MLSAVIGEIFSFRLKGMIKVTSKTKNIRWISYQQALHFWKVWLQRLLTTSVSNDKINVLEFVESKNLLLIHVQHTAILFILCIGMEKSSSRKHMLLVSSFLNLAYHFTLVVLTECVGSLTKPQLLVMCIMYSIIYNILTWLNNMHALSHFHLLSNSKRCTYYLL